MRDEQMMLGECSSFAERETNQHYIFRFCSISSNPKRLATFGSKRPLSNVFISVLQFSSKSLLLEVGYEALLKIQIQQFNRTLQHGKL